jgi:hypothetical protein
MLKIGPDGALYIADMYRLVIEHPEWIPAPMQKRLDLRAGFGHEAASTASIPKAQSSA